MTRDLLHRTQSTGASLQLVYCWLPLSCEENSEGPNYLVVLWAFFNHGIHSHYITSQVTELGDGTVSTQSHSEVMNDKPSSLCCNMTPIKPYCKMGKKPSAKVNQLKGQSPKSVLGKAAN